jgi:hypothetical protein
MGAFDFLFALFRDGKTIPIWKQATVLMAQTNCIGQEMGSDW